MNHLVNVNVYENKINKTINWKICNGEKKQINQLERKVFLFTSSDSLCFKSFTEMTCYEIHCHEYTNNRYYRIYSKFALLSIF